MFGSQPRVISLVLGIVVLTGIVSSVAPVEAAQTVILKYRFLRESVSVAELSSFARTGELSPKLKTYLRLAGREPGQLRRALTQEFTVDPNLLSSILNSPLGEVMLAQVSEVIHTPDNIANRESLRGALVSSALPDRKVTLIETLENYPTPEVHVEGERLVEVAQRLGRLLRNVPNLPNIRF